MHLDPFAALEPPQQQARLNSRLPQQRRRFDFAVEPRERLVGPKHRD
jgi:hypothetical protein